MKIKLRCMAICLAFLVGYLHSTPGACFAGPLQTGTTQTASARTAPEEAPAKASSTPDSDKVDSDKDKVDSASGTKGADAGQGDRERKSAAESKSQPATKSVSDGKSAVPSKEQSRKDFKLTSQAMTALKSSPPLAVRLAEQRLNAEIAIDRPLHARLCWIAGSGACYMQDFSRAYDHLSEAETLARGLDDAPLLRRSLRFKAAACLELGKYKEGSAAAREGLEISEQLQDASPYPALLHNELAGNEVHLENYAVAIEHYRKSIEIARKHDNDEMAMMTQHNLADVLSDFGRFEEAAFEYEQVLEAAREVGNDFLVAAAASSCGSAQLQMGQVGTASDLLQESLASAKENGWKDIEAVSLLGIGELDWLAGSELAGGEKIKQAEAIFRQIGDSVAALSAKDKLESLQEKKTVEQIDSLNRLLAEANELGDRRFLLDLHRKLALANEEAGQFEEAVEHLRAIEGLRAAIQAAEDQGILEKLRELTAENDELRSRVEQQNYDSILGRLASDAKIKETKLASSRTLATVLGCSAFLLILGLVVLYRGYHSRSRLASDLKAAGELLQVQSKRNIELERKAGEEERLESLSVLAAGVAHDFNNLLTAISGAAQFGQLSPDLVKKDQMLQQVVEVSDQAAGLTKQLVQFLGGKDSEDVSSPGLALQGNQGMLETLCKKAGLALELSQSGVHEMVGLGDLQFQQILVNIVTNAIDASPPRGTIRVELSKESLDREALDKLDVHQSASDGLFVRLRVCDEGKGIGRSVKKRMFDPYFSTRRRGRGLGLSSVLGIVQSCKGAINVAAGRSRGTEFNVYLPVVRSVSVPALPQPVQKTTVVKTTPVHPQAKSVADAVHGANILLVDDDELTLRTTANLLAVSGMNVTTAEGAKQALEILSEKSHEIACVVTDLTMPKFSGKWLAKQIAVRWPTIPVVLYSGCVDGNIDLDEAGIASFVQKPFKSEEVVPLIKELILSTRKRTGSQTAATA